MPRVEGVGESRGVEDQFPLIGVPDDLVLSEGEPLALEDGKIPVLDVVSYDDLARADDAKHFRKLGRETRFRNRFGRIDGDGLRDVVAVGLQVDENGVQETITTVATPSITTYSEGEVVTADAEYKAGNIIYVVVNNGTSNETLTVGTNANLYTVTLEPSTDTGDIPAATAAQVISEESVKNALTNGTKDNEANPTTWTIKDANKWKLVVTKANTSLSAVTQIEAEDSPTGNAISVNGAKFTAGTAGTVYVFEFLTSLASDATKTYKVIKVATGS